MELIIEKLHKFLKLETEKGYKNVAIIGGLDKIIPWWEKEARENSLDPEVIQGVINRLYKYPQLEPEAREITIKELFRLLDIFSQETHDRTYPSSRQFPKTEIDLPEFSQQPGIQHSKNLLQPSSGQASSKGNRMAGIPPVQGLDAPLTTLNNIGTHRSKNLSTLGLYTLYDLLYYFPRRYDDYSQLKPINRIAYGEILTIIGSIHSIQSRQVRSGRVSQITEAVLTDGTGFLRVLWFNQIWIGSRLHPGYQIVVSGKVEMNLGRFVMKSPEWEPLEKEHLHTNRIVPVYPLTSEVTQKSLRSIIHETVSFFAPRLPDFLPSPVRRATGLMTLADAISQIHFPESQEKLEAAHARLAFDEIFLLQIGVLQQKRNWQETTAQAFSVSQNWLDSIINSLPFTLTNAQQKTIQDVQKDLASTRPMNRLIQGDVGSGKTIIAALAIAIISQAEAQSAFMVPTSILAEQHYRSLQKILATDYEGHPAVMQSTQIRLMLGDTPEAGKREIRAGLEDGSIKLVIGTHALLQDPVQFNHLQLAIVDEQHRFGVEQRSILRSKGNNPHLLVMTATPIPRSLALTVYGDLDLSVMDEMPAGRHPVETHVMHPIERERAYTLIRSQVEKGHQAFIIYPLVEKGEREEGKAAVEEHARLQKEIFPDLKLGLLHGRLRPDEKDHVMVAFNNMDFQILVSTSVVEVGVDISNATIMLIEGANRFGLAQLHQFRGRVGRGDSQAYCLLIPETEDSLENERLAVMVQTNNGFVLAERDLEQRGPGEFLGTRQSGYSELKLANLTDVRLIEKARQQAQSVFDSDPDLSSTEHEELNKMMARFWSGSKGDLS